MFAAEELNSNLWIKQYPLLEQAHGFVSLF